MYMQYCIVQYYKLARQRRLQSNSFGCNNTEFPTVNYSPFFSWVVCTIYCTVNYYKRLSKTIGNTVLSFYYIQYSTLVLSTKPTDLYRRMTISNSVQVFVNSIVSKGFMVTFLINSFLSFSALLQNLRRFAHRP